MRLFAIVWSIALLLAAPAWAQSGNPAFMVLGLGPHQPNPSDRVFVHAAALGGMAEVELGRLAQEKAQSDAVEDFARRMVEDHSAANDRLISLAKEDGFAVPDELDQEHKEMRARLETMSGAEFDVAYLRGQVADHQKTTQLLEYEIGSGQHMEITSFASEILPVVLGHLRMARDILDQLAG